MTTIAKTSDLRIERGHFPALSRQLDGRPLVFFDGPAGTQVPSRVIEAISGYYRQCNANARGRFPTSRESDEKVAEARRALADLLGASHPDQISFGANMTSLTFMLSRAIGRELSRGDEILITQLDHEANRGPWLGLRSRGVKVREVRMRLDGTLDYDDFASKIGERTRLVAMGHASNLLGTVNHIQKVRDWTRQVGAWLLIDAVHSAPHLSLDAAELGCDFLLCSAYKFYGPHLGVLYCRGRLLEQLQTDRLRTQDPRAPHRIETGTLNHAAIVGASAAVECLASLGRGHARRERLIAAFQRIFGHEWLLAEKLYRGLQQIAGIQTFGPDFEKSCPKDKPDKWIVTDRAPTVSFTVEGMTARQVAEKLGRQGIQVWDGDFYAARAVEVLGLAERGGLVRAGMAIYNQPEEVDRLLEASRRMKL